MEVTERVNIHVKLYHKRYEEIFSQPVTFTYLPQNGSAYYPKSPPFRSITHNRQPLTNQQPIFQNQFEGDSSPNESVSRWQGNFNQVQPHIESGNGNYVGAARSDGAQNASYCGSCCPMPSQDETNSIIFNSIDSVHDKYQSDAISQSSPIESNLCIKEEKSQNGIEAARQNSTEKTVCLLINFCMYITLLNQRLFFNRYLLEMQTETSKFVKSTWIPKNDMKKSLT